MNTIYWITRLDSLHDVSFTFFVVSLIICGLAGGMFYITNGHMIYDEAHGYQNSAQEFKGYRKTCLNTLSYSLSSAFIWFILTFFVPTTKEALMIYGVGGSIDYLKSNPTAKQLPDKCIKALDKWVDTWNIKENDSIK
jgi:hypothetical protein